MEPLADDHSSDSDDTPTGIEESAAPAAPKRTVMSLLERLQAIRITSPEQATIMTALCLCVLRKMRTASPARACMSASIALLSFVFVVACSWPVPSLALRMGSNDLCDSNLCCPSFRGCPRGHHPGVEFAARFDTTRENAPGSDTQ